MYRFKSHQLDKEEKGHPVYRGEHNPIDSHLLFYLDKWTDRDMPAFTRSRKFNPSGVEYYVVAPDSKGYYNPLDNKIYVNTGKSIPVSKCTDGDYLPAHSIGETGDAFMIKITDLKTI